MKHFFLSFSFPSPKAYKNIKLLLFKMPILELSQFLFQSYFFKQLTELLFVLVMWKTNFSFANN